MGNFKVRTNKGGASENLLNLGLNSYPGRGIIVGLDETGENLVQVYWTMGRRPSSRNRIFEKDENGRVFTVPVDPTQVIDPLTIYNAMRESRIRWCW